MQIEVKKCVFCHFSNIYTRKVGRTPVSTMISWEYMHICVVINAWKYQANRLMHSEDIYCRYLAVFIHRQAKYCILWSHLTELPHNVFMHVLTGPQFCISHCYMLVGAHHLFWPYFMNISVKNSLLIVRLHRSVQDVTLHWLRWFFLCM